MQPSRQELIFLLTSYVMKLTLVNARSFWRQHKEQNSTASLAVPVCCTSCFFFSVWLKSIIFTITTWTESPGKKHSADVCKTQFCSMYNTLLIKTKNLNGALAMGMAAVQFLSEGRDVHRCTQTYGRMQPVLVHLTSTLSFHLILSAFSPFNKKPTVPLLP